MISTLLQTYFTIAFLIQIDTWTGSRFGDSKGFSHSIWLAIVDMLQGYGSDYVLLWREDLQTSLFLAMSKQRGVYVVSFLCLVRFVVDHFPLIPDGDDCFSFSDFVWMYFDYLLLMAEILQQLVFGLST